MTRTLATFLLALAVMACTPEPANYDLDAVKSAGDPIVRSLALYKKAHGNYPLSLEEAGISNASTDIGKFKYERGSSSSGEYFILFTGDYSRNGFVLLWNSAITPQGWVIEE